MQKPSKKSVLKGLIGGGFGLAFLCVLLATFGFNGESYYHDDPIGIQFGMSIDPITQDSFIWMHSPRALFVRASITKVVKYDIEGKESPAGLVDLFPMSGATFGGIEVDFEIFAVDEETMPDLSTHDQELIPMAYISKSAQLPFFHRHFMMLGAIALNHWGLFKFMIVSNALVAIILGIRIRHKNKNSADEPVKGIKSGVM